MKLNDAAGLKQQALDIHQAAMDLFDDIEHGHITPAGADALDRIGRLQTTIVAEVRLTAALNIATAPYQHQGTHQ